MDQVAKLSIHNEDNKSINQWNKLIESKKSDITDHNINIKKLDRKLESSQKSKSIITAFILIKYGISYVEYLDHMKSKLVIDKSNDYDI